MRHVCKVDTAKILFQSSSVSLAMDADYKMCMQIGATRGSQLEETLRAIQDGPLDESIAKRVDKVWELVKDEAPIDNYHL